MAGPVTQGHIPLTGGDRATQIAAIAGVNLLVGATVSAAAVGFGMSRPMAIVLTAGMFSGAAQFAAMSTFASSGSTAVVLISAMLINTRFLLLGASLATRIGVPRGPRVALAGMLVDPIVILAQRETTAARTLRTYVIGGAVTLLSWTVGAVVGAIGAVSVRNVEAVGLDVALPALLLAVVASGARSVDQRLAAASGAVIGGVLLLLGVGSSTIVIASVGGCVVPMVVRAVREGSPDGRTTGDGGE